MSEIEIPKRFDKILKNDQRLQGALKTTTAKFCEWLYPNKLVFFPEYTDHGTRHIQDVLNTADSIIRLDALEALTPEDIYVLVLSILLHDCAMHISKQGLKDLIENQIYSSSLFAYPIEDPFSLKWSKFETEVSKYTDKDWLKFFSDGSIVSFPNLKDDLTEKQHVIIGEFIRKHHARMAQVIALHGVPTGGKPEIFFEPDLLHLNELAGFAARSHNISLREAVELVGKDHARITKNTHLAFIMGVLRIADYLQFEKKRTPKICFNVQAFCSPISIHEWKKQMAVINTHNIHNDEELLYVDAAPDDALTLEGIGGLIKGLQSELDAFWAVQGEMYSRIPEKRNLGINVRRVRSSIDNPEDFVKKHYKKFHPKLLGLTTNDERLYPLLAGPLYGEKPLIGLRELLQNSIDACNERYAATGEKTPTFDEVPYGVKVYFDIENKTLSITDEGNGMDIEIIEKYFLKIGSSYRYSAAWQEKFLKEDGAIVPRTGRFGIGVLAGFLLGNKITVHTRKLNTSEERGLTFSMTPSSQKIQIDYLKRDDYGTTITIELNDKTLSRIGSIKKKRHTIPTYYYRGVRNEREENEWRWYYLDSPRIEVNFLAEGKQDLPANETINKKDLLESWNLVPSSSTVKCYWKKTGNGSNVYCNGFVIPNIASPEIRLNGIVSTSVTYPYEIFFIDNDAALPLNLQRNAFVSEDFFNSKKIQDEILKKHISLSLVSLKNLVTAHGEINHNFYNSSPVIYSGDSTFAIKSGSAIPLHPGFEFNPKDFYIIDYRKSSTGRGLTHHLLQKLDEYGYISLSEVDKQSSESRRALAYFIGAPPNSHYLFTNEINSEAPCQFEGWHFIKQFDFDKLDDREHEALQKYGYTITKLPDTWVSICKNSNLENIPSAILDLFNNKVDLNCFMFSLVSIHNNHCSSSEFHTLWNELGLPNSVNASYFDKQV